MARCGFDISRSHPAIARYNAVSSHSTYGDGNSSMARLPGSILFVILLGGLFGQTTLAEESPAVKSLWQTAPPSPAVDQPSTARKPWILRDREIALHPPLLNILKDAGARPHPRIVIELFDGDSHELDITSTVSRYNDTAIIRGTFKPPSDGDFTFAINGNVLVGTMHLNGRLYKAEHIANGRLRLLELDPEKLPPD